MSDLSFRISPNIILGSYTVNRLPQYLKEWGERFMVIFDPILKEVELEEKVLGPLKERNIDFFIFDSLNDGVKTEQIADCVELAKNSHVHGIIAVGGAKTINTAIAVSSLINEDVSIYDLCDGYIPTKEYLPVICVPSTMRVPFVFTEKIPIIDGRYNQVKMINVQKGICKFVVFDSNFVLTLTENQKNSMVLEALCLATEAYLSQKASFFSDMFVEKSVELLGYGLNGSASLDIVTPQEILVVQAGCMASLACSISSVGLGSMFSTAMNARFRLSRSLVSSVIYPYLLEDWSKYKLDRLEKLVRIFNKSSKDFNFDQGKEEIVQQFIESIRLRLVKANLPTRLKDLSLSVEQLALIAEDASSLDMMNLLPRSMTGDDLFDILKLAY